MSIYHKVRAVERLFNTLDGELNKFKKESGLFCIAGCGKCCQKPDIFAAPLEFLPWAYHVLKLGQAEEWFERLTMVPQTPICLILSTMETDGLVGQCTDYQYRGLICRLFGFAAMLNKQKKKEMVTCKIIKTEQADAFQKTAARINVDLHVPVISRYYNQLRGLDAKLGTETIPINEAMLYALREVVAYYQYRKPPTIKKSA